MTYIKIGEKNKMLFKLHLIIISISLLIFSISCTNSKTDIEYYANSKEIKEKRYYPDEKNDSTFYFMSYYHNGKTRSEGWVKNFRTEGKWIGYYSDGQLQDSIFFLAGIADYSHYSRKTPQIIMNDSLVIGKETMMKVTNLYPDERLLMKGKAKIDFLDSEQPFDYKIVPEEKGVIIFYTEQLTPVSINKECLNYLYRKKLINFDNQNKDYVKIYKPILLELATFIVD